MADPKFQSFFDKIKNHQGAVDAMLKVGEVMKNKGMPLSHRRMREKQKGG
jgi:hypothetical protein